MAGKKHKTYGGKNHREVTVHDKRGVPYWTCPECGKRCFRSRADAKEAVRFGFQGRRMRFYQCGEFWHFTSYSARRVTKWRDYQARKETS